ncbi:methyltransferase domain-containing protein [Staphylococcus edaphicus]|uniref:methyltransferase domain-containing protein n=1 Tax=Staphylococcus edaphicus TaxID=1955013 RepID=UPI00268A4769
MDIIRENALDIVCGGGIYTFTLKRLGFNCVTGIDSSSVILKSAKTENFKKIDFRIGDFLIIIFLIICISLFYQERLFIILRT